MIGPIDAAGNEIPTFEELWTTAREEPMLYACLLYLHRGIITREEFYLLALKVYIEESKRLRGLLFDKKSTEAPTMAVVCKGDMNLPCALKARKGLAKKRGKT